MRYWKPRTIPGDPHVTLVIAAYLDADPRRAEALTCLLYSLKAQTYPHWDAVVVHDGPLMTMSARLLNSALSTWAGKVTVIPTAERLGQAGHPHRHRYASTAKGKFVGFANDDVYYAPVYLEWLVSELVKHDADIAYCDMVHSHQMWKPFTTAPRRGKIDVGGFLVRRTLVQTTSWPDFEFNSDGRYFEALAARARKVVKVPATLYVHN